MPWFGCCRPRQDAAEKIRLVEEAMQPGMPFARRADVAPSLLLTWRRRMLEGGPRAFEADEDLVGCVSPVFPGRLRKIKNNRAF
jgi:transposase-like protein